jgi:hypothetical protein
MKWSVPTRDTRVAAALANLQVPVDLKAVYDERTGREEATFFFEPHSPDGKFLADPILGGFRSGKLERTDPAHPFLTGLRAQVNRERQLDLANKGIRCRLVPVAQGAVWHYVPDPAAALPGCTEGEKVLRTGDLKLVAALGTVGFPVLHLRGSAPFFEWFLPITGPGGLDGIELLRRLRAPRETADNLHPFFLAYDCLVNRERLLDLLRTLHRKIHLHAKSSHRRAVISADAPKKEWDEVSRFFRG